MKFSASSLLLLAGSAVMAAPTSEPASIKAWKSLSKRGLTDADILNFALTLEHLEATFYKEGLAKFPQAAFDAKKTVPRLRFNIGEISADETEHVSFLTTALKAAGATPVQQCSYNFGLTDVDSFLVTSKTLEGVGVSAYLGAAAAITEKAYLTAAGSILTVEARHDAYIRDNQMAPGPQSPFPSPFDVPLDPMEVFSLAAGFITKCPAGSNLPFTAFPGLSVSPASATAYQRAGQKVTLASKASLKGAIYCAFPAIAGPYFAPATISGSSATCTVPDGIAGESYVILSKSGTAISDADTIAGPAILQVQSKYTYAGFPM